MKELRQGTTYKGNYTDTSPVVQWFWVSDCLFFLSPFVLHTVGQVNLCLFSFMYHVFTGLFVIAEPER